MLQHLQTLLEGMVANPESCLLDLPLLTAAQRHQLLVEWNDTQVAYPHNVCLHQLFEAQVEKTPDAIAVIFEGQQLTYRELNQQANQIAHYLQKIEIKPDTLIGIFLERSRSTIAGLLGILKAGGAYVPLDPSYPMERLAFMLEDAQVPVLLTQQSLLDKLPKHNAKVICLDSDREIIEQYSIQNPIPPTPRDLNSEASSGFPLGKGDGRGIDQGESLIPNSSNLAYVIYTSGSTGKPKGAMNTHRGICNRLLWMQDTYRLTESDRVLQKTPLSFDVSVWECFYALLTGSCVVLAKPGGHQDSAYLVKLIQQQQISTVHFVPSMLQVFLQEPDVELCHSLKRVICSGEALSVELKERFFERLEGVELHNLYGPTEAAIDVTSWKCQPQEKIVPIGRAIANTQIYILDRNLQLVPIGVPGELHIGGVGLARGYLNREDLTDKQFIPNPFGKGKLYKTGDLACYLEDGNIEFLGRIDNQIKIRGFRIELGEIEAALRQHPDIQEAVVILREDKPDDKKLVAYIIPLSKRGRGDLPSQLRQFLKQHLPEYMLPSVYVWLDALPLTANGKLDRRALPVPEPQGLEQRDRNAIPQTPVEKSVAKIWAEVLNWQELGIHDNFFELGGHSLLATQLASKIRKTFQVELPLSSIFDMPTIAQLAREIEKLKCDRPQESTSMPTPVSRSDRRTSLSALRQNANM
jgi:amino acid adenylation domain-containing protein